MALKIKYGILLCLCVLVATQETNLTIHGIAHSHNDAGWLMSFDKYYELYTERILDNVVEILLEQEDKVFHWADIAFFARWFYKYNQVDLTKRDKIQKLIKEGKFVFVGGGWVMNDEALPSYKESMLQMRTGLSFLKEHLNVRPTIAWQIDSFGHSAATVAVLHKLGYEAIVGNRISLDYKKKLANKDGFNFYWQGHQVSEDPKESMLFTHILTDHYNSFKVWNEGMALTSNIDTEKTKIYEKEISPSLTATQVLSNNKSLNFHSMVCLGDDFFFVKAPELFKKYDDLLIALKTEALEKGMQVDAKYSSLYSYFEGIYDSGNTYGLFKGDFLPYNEPKEDYEDYWTGYYSTRLHLKKYIRYAFNQLQGARALKAITFSQTGSINNVGSSNYHGGRDETFLKIEELWSILMHHDAITGTHEYETEPSYYKILDDAIKMIDAVYSSLNNYGGNYIYPFKLSREFFKIYRYSQAYSFFFVNPSLSERHEVMNVTIPYKLENKNYFPIIETTLKNEVIQTYITEIYEIDENTHEMKKVKKLFFDLKMEGLSTARLYLVETNANNIFCSRDGIICPEIIKPKMIDDTYQMKNNKIELDFDKNGNLIKITKPSELDFEEEFQIKEEINYYKTDEGSRSGHYIFNPMKKKTTMKFDLNEKYEYQIGNLVKILQVYSKNENDKVLKTYSVISKGSSKLMEQFSLQLEFYSERKIEANLSFKLPKKKHSTFSAYVDDSMKLVERPIYNKNANTKSRNDVEKTGYFTYPCVYGGALKSSHKSRDIYFGWLNSNPIGCTFSEKNRVEIMIYRKFSNNGNACCIII